MGGGSIGLLSAMEGNFNQLADETPIALERAKEKEGVRERERTFTAYTTHPGLFWFLPDDELIFSGVVRTRRHLSRDRQRK